jgi:hypothetical protein
MKHIKSIKSAKKILRDIKQDLDELDYVRSQMGDAEYHKYQNMLLWHMKDCYQDLTELYEDNLGILGKQL